MNNNVNKLDLKYKGKNIHLGSRGGKYYLTKDRKRHYLSND